MKKNILGRTGMEVTELCFGVLPIGPLQANIDPKEAARVLRLGMDAGINFFDTAEIYRTAKYIGEAMKGFSGELIITSKSPAQTYEGMEKSIGEALEDLGRSYIDIMLLHSARFGGDLFDVFEGAWNCLKDYKKKGVIRAIGCSCHNVNGVLNAAENDDLDIIFPLNNFTGLGVMGGTNADMTRAIVKCQEANKGIYLMKALGGGVFMSNYQEAMEFARSLPVAAQAVGMINEKELDFNLRYFNGEPIAEEEFGNLKFNKSLTILPNVCKSCGTCIAHCPSGALTMGKHKSGKDIPVVNKALCVSCGYCTQDCPEFAIRMI